MCSPAAEQAHRIGRVISKDKQLRTNFEDAFLSDLVQITEAYSCAVKNTATLQITETQGGTAVKFEILIEGWKNISYIR